jgi:hypothetical protein
MRAWTIMMLALAFTANGFAAATPAQKLPNQPGKIVVEPDQTDIYAIPLDEDADEQQQELYNLEHPKK